MEKINHQWSLCIVLQVLEIKMKQSWWFAPLALMLTLTITETGAETFTANLSTTWINSDYQVAFQDGSIVRHILPANKTWLDKGFACGFICNGTCNTYFFAIFIIQTSPNFFIPPRAVWFANRDYPVKHNATLELTSDGNLVLRDVDDTLAWSTNTSDKSVAGLNLTDVGNLLLFDVNNSVVWQSFDHPTDTLVPGQRLVSGHKLISSVSETNWSQGQYSLSLTNDVLFASIESNPPQAYYGHSVSRDTRYVKFENRSLDVYVRSYPQPVEIINFWKSPGQYMKLTPDGHLNVYDYVKDKGWLVVKDMFDDSIVNEWEYPMVCGKNGVWLERGCSCPRSINDSKNYFRQIVDNHPDLGCLEVTPLTCDASRYHTFLELKDVTYFAFSSDISNTDIDSCKEACLRNCSCKAAFFRESLTSSSWDCYLPSETFSMVGDAKKLTEYNSSAFIKVQIPQIAHIEHRKNSNRLVILGSTTGGFFLLAIIIAIAVLKMRKKRKSGEDEEDYLYHVPGMPNRFSYEELKIATENFATQLGKGGFGSVFEGVLEDFTKIAVKRLDGIGQVKKSFLAEVESIGHIHHVNLVRLIGFCVEKSESFLVYEHMANGSLDRWIYNRSQEDFALDWGCRRKIIQDVAKGLAYLHEDCLKKIIHLDIKPQNILLDEKYNAKLSDFGLSKLIDRDQSQVMTTMRGTPGYLAPEWLSSVITEKVDVYSFGVVVLEILCGRKNFEVAEPEECRHLLSLLKIKAEEGRMFDLIDKRSEDMQSQGTKVLEIMRLAAWCLQNDYSKRPSMSMVVKVLEGHMDVEKNLDYSSLNSHTFVRKASENRHAETTPLLPSVLSAAR